MRIQKLVSLSPLIERTTLKIGSADLRLNISLDCSSRFTFGLYHGVFTATGEVLYSDETEHFEFSCNRIMVNFSEA